MLKTRIRLHQNPWPHTVPDRTLIGLIETLAERRAAHIEKMFEADDYKRPSFGLAVMLPNAPQWMRSSDALLFTIATGEEGDRFVKNAIAKAFYHHDHGHPAGFGRYMDLAASQDGDFCYGYSTKVDDTIGGGSAQSEIQDAMEAGHAIVTFNYWVRLERETWLDLHPDNGWFCDQNEPGARYSEATEREVIYDSAAA